MRVLFPFAFAAAFFGWLLYRLFIKKDLQQHLNEVGFGFFFIAVWTTLYFVLWN
jgi:high-affinity Fe2+/Pb2+ permease